jgi:hypothetical protein
LPSYDHVCRKPSLAKRADNKMGKEGEDEMTVVVPPPNSSRLNADSGKDKDTDTAMAGTQDGEHGENGTIDPKVKAMNGLSCS